MNRAGQGSLKLLIALVVLMLSAGTATAASYLPSTKYINIQTEFDELVVTLEKTHRVDFVAHCPGFANGSCPRWDIYDTTISQNRTDVTFIVWDKGAYIGIYNPELNISKVNLTAIKRTLESLRNITINKLNLTDSGLYLEFTLPLKGMRNASIVQRDAIVKIAGLKNESMFKNAQLVDIGKITYRDEVVPLKTNIVAIDAHNFTQASIKLPKNGTVTAIMKCSDWNFSLMNCSVSWINMSATQNKAVDLFNLTLQDIWDEIEDIMDKFFLNPIFVPSGVSIGQSLPK